MDYEHLFNAMIGLSISQQDDAKSAEAICIKPGEKDQAWDLSQFVMDQVQRPEFFNQYSYCEMGPFF